MQATSTATSTPTLGHGAPLRVLRRYANRKIYDPYQSRYVNHADIAELVRSGSQVRVLDSRTDRDVTGLALARILSIEENRAEGARAEALYGLLRAASGEAPPVAERGDRRVPPEAAPQVVDALLAQGQRGAFAARGWIAAQREALGGLEARARQRGEEAAEALNTLLAVKSQLERLARRLDEVQDRLAAAEGP
jgi:hypothetical protein